jgi:hypothetical protein
MTKSRLSLLLLLAALLCLASWLVPARAVTWTNTVNPVTPQVASATGAATTLTGTLTGSTSRMTYLEGFDLTGLGATAASGINITTTGLTTNLNFAVAIQAGVTAPAFGTTAAGPSVYSIRFPTPIPASATNTNITVSVPSFGSGNTLASLTVYGFTQ